MRLSVYKGDPGYRPDVFDLGAIVTVDGVEVKECFTADEELGEAHCYRTPLEVDYSTGDIVSVVKRGVVKIIIPGAI